MVSAVAPKKYSIGSRKIMPMLIMKMACMTHIIVTLPTTAAAFSVFFCPRNIEDMVAPPTATSTQNATTRFISGKVIAKPVMAIEPTPLPMNMLSTIL